MKKIAIYGAGGLGKEVKSLIEQINGKMPIWDIIGFFDDGKHGQIVNGKPVLGGIEVMNNWKDPLSVIFAIGNPQIKKFLSDKCHNHNLSYPVLIHPSVIIQDLQSCKIGSGSMICAGSILTVDVVIGDHVLINLNTTIGHDVKVGAFSSIMPSVNLSGNVTLEESVFIGSGSNIINSVRLANDSIIGAGSVVLKNVNIGDTVVGVPAKSTKKE